MNELDNGDFRARVARLEALGVNPYPSMRDLSSIPEARRTVGRIVERQPGRLRLAMTAASEAVEYEISSDAAAVIAELRCGDVVAAVVGGGTILDITPVVVVRQTLESCDPAPDQARPEQREQEIFWNDTTRRALEVGARILSLLRANLEARDFLEVTMPVLTTNPDISPNAPFRTETAGGERLCMRTTYPYSERLMYSLTKAYQLGPNFRDEAEGAERSPEFNMLSIGQAMTDYDEMMDFGEELVRDIVLSVRGSTRLCFLDEEVDFAKPWLRIPTATAVAELAGIDVDDCFDLARLEAALDVRGLPRPVTPFSATRGQIYHGAVFDVLLKNLVYPRLRQPTFLTEFPYFFGGPGRPVDGDRRFKMRAEGFVAGIEIAETASVLTDPRQARTWHRDVLAEKRAIGWLQDQDEGYLSTVDRGLLLPSVIAFGIERLTMVVMEKSHINQVIWYSHRL